MRKVRSIFFLSSLPPSSFLHLNIHCLHFPSLSPLLSYSLLSFIWIPSSFLISPSLSNSSAYLAIWRAYVSQSFLLKLNTIQGSSWRSIISLLVIEIIMIIMIKVMIINKMVIAGMTMSCVVYLWLNYKEVWKSIRTWIEFISSTIY